MPTDPQEATFAGTEGSVFYRRFSPDAGSVQRIAIVVHGYAEHSGRYRHLAERLAVAGTATYAPDHLGHGNSDGERALITDFEHVVDDLGILADIAAVEHPGVPLFLIGHSMGGLLTARFCERWPERVSGAVFLGAVLGDWEWARRVVTTDTIPHVPSDPNGMSRDPDACRQYAEDPLVYHGTYKKPLLASELETLDRFNAELDRIVVPVLFLHGTEDPFVPYQASLDAVERMPSLDKTAKLYHGARHELVNETNREEVVSDIVAFVERVTAGLPLSTSAETSATGGVGVERPPPG
jgi:alpha-beta hydrolase superfamily lysophospholipase